MAIASRVYLRCALGTALALMAFSAAAADITAPAPDQGRDQAQQLEQAKPALGRWLIRARGLGVITNDSGSVNGVPGSDLTYSDTVVPEFDVSYFFTDNIAAELILGTTYSRIRENGAVGVPVGKTWLLPPTLTLQYHVTELGAFKPYVGAGVNYTFFYNESNEAGFHNLKIDNHLGLALQAGFDYMLDDHWGVNVDVKKIFLKTDWSADHDALGSLSGKAKLDPWLVGTGVTYRF